MLYPHVTEVVATTGDLAGFQRLGTLLHEVNLPAKKRAALVPTDADAGPDGN